MYFASYLAAGVKPVTTLNVQNWLVKNAVPLTLLVIGIGIMFAAKKRDHKGTVSTVGIVLVGLMVIGIAVSQLAVGIGTWLAVTVFG